MDPLKSSAPVSPLDPVPGNRGQGASVPSPAPAKGAPSAAPAGDSVTLSQAARLLAAAGTAPAQQSAATASRLAALKKNIADGTYVVDQKLIARSLIQDTLDLLGATPPTGA